MSGMHDYKDIIDLPHPVSSRHPRMALVDRAAQFAAFAALSGYEAAVKETARQTDKKVELSETEINMLNVKLQMLQEHLTEQPEVSVTYFIPDEKKTGGAYQTVCGFVRKVDPFARVLALTNGMEIPLDAVMKLDSGLFNERLPEL